MPKAIGNEAQKSGMIRTVSILEIGQETKDTKTFYFKDPDTKPSQIVLGQFYMVWVPRVGEAPFGISSMNDDGTVSVTVQKKGKVTSALHKLMPGDRFGVKGPFGNGFSIPTNIKRLVVVAGGIGAAPFGPLRRDLVKGKITVVLGAKRSEELLFEERFNRAGLDVRLSTDDGSCGYKGFATHCFKDMFDELKPDLVLTCGPEVMMKGVMDLCSEKKVPMQASLERLMKCGMGICDVCSIDGFQVCRDGPVFTGQALRGLSEFGASKRDASGRLVGL
jgi:dihydroorotate dehydrogenase electron transfer subunit